MRRCLGGGRWRGIRRWASGDVWALQSHHLIELLVPENTPLEAGVRYATTAGVHVGSHEHTHFEFKIGRPRQAGENIDFDDESGRIAACDLQGMLTVWSTGSGQVCGRAASPGLS